MNARAHPGSLRRRLLLVSLALTLTALVAAGGAVGFILHRFVRGQLDGRLDERVVALAADLRTGESLGHSRTGEAPPFDRPRSGWYWQVRRGNDTLRSASLAGRELATPPRGKESGDPNRIEPADGTGPWDDALVMRMRVLPGDPPTTILVSAPVAALRGPIGEALATLALCLGLLGLLLAGGAWLQVHLGLRPLARLRDELAAVRAGKAERLPAGQAAEVRPLTLEINALLDQNAAGLEAARAHVANLAHGLKTPLATLALALANRGEADGELGRLVDGMDRRVRHHLRRARSAAKAGPVRARAVLFPHVHDLRTALLRIHADKAMTIRTDVPTGLSAACDPQDLDEMLGNIVENACRWCRSQVRVSAASRGQEVVIIVDDDGPGLAVGEIADVLQRGRRLDESTPGHGFGLPISVELAELYGGKLELGRADLGGLSVTLTLPA